MRLRTSSLLHSTKRYLTSEIKFTKNMNWWKRRRGTKTARNKVLPTSVVLRQFDLADKAFFGCSFIQVVFANFVYWICSVCLRVKFDALPLTDNVLVFVSCNFTFQWQVLLVFGVLFGRSNNSTFAFFYRPYIRHNLDSLAKGKRVCFKMLALWPFIEKIHGPLKKM